MLNEILGNNAYNWDIKKSGMKQHIVAYSFGACSLRNMDPKENKNKWVTTTTSSKKKNKIKQTSNIPENGFPLISFWDVT